MSGDTEHVLLPRKSRSKNASPRGRQPLFEKRNTKMKYWFVTDHEEWEVVFCIHFIHFFQKEETTCFSWFRGISHCFAVFHIVLRKPRPFSPQAVRDIVFAAEWRLGQERRDFEAARTLVAELNRAQVPSVRL